MKPSEPFQLYISGHFGKFLTSNLDLGYVLLLMSVERMDG